jgi:hypothetical protein
MELGLTSYKILYISSSIIAVLTLIPGAIPTPRCKNLDLK